MKKIQQFYDEPIAMTWYEAMEKYENHPKWKFPTSNELIAMYKSNKESFEGGFYWSSSEYNSNNAWYVYFNNGYTSSRHLTSFNLKTNTCRIRVIRAF